MFKRILSVIIICVLTLSLSACKGADTSAMLYAEIGEKISTLDPQLASSAQDRIIVLNTFEGLMRMGADGNIVPGVAESYSLDGNTYTFYLRKNAKWSDAQDLTADDFLFAFRRAVSPKTNAPDYNYLDCISGASAVRGGADESALGVNVIDEHTLSITLDYKNDEFLETLTRPICMPCNEEFFKASRGKYGRDSKNLLSNGSYYVSLWGSDDNYVLTLRRNKEYEGDFTAQNSAVYITSSSTEQLPYLLNKNTIDLCFLENTQAATAKNDGLVVDNYYNRLWFLCINKNSVLGEWNVRRAICGAVNREEIKSSKPDFATDIYLMAAPTVMFGENDVSALLADTRPFGFNADAAHSLYTSHAKDIEAASPLSILYSSDSALDSLLSAVASNLQKNLGLFINMTALDTVTDVNSAVEKGDYTAALCGINICSLKAYDTLSHFKSGNIFGYNNSDFDASLLALKTAENSEQYISAILSSEQKLLSDCSVYPLVSTPTVVSYNPSLSNVKYCIQNENIDFSIINKK